MHKSYKYTQEKLMKVKEIKRSIVEKCSECGRTGFTSSPLPGKVYRCNCMIVFIYIKELVKANISQDYWTLNLKTLEIDQETKNMVERYLKNIHKAIEKSMGLIFIGPNGTGKTALMNMIGMEAITQGIPVGYLTFSELLSASIPGTPEDEFENITYGKILLIDELDKGYRKKGSGWVEAKFDEILRKFYSVGKTLVLATNWEEEKIRKEFGESFYSMMMRRNQFIIVGGLDYSSKISVKYWENLEKEYDYNHENITKMAYKLAYRKEEKGCV